MAATSADNDEVLNLRRRARRRLVGASALVLFLVIVPPLWMDLEPKPASTHLAVEIPSKDAKALPPVGGAVQAPAPIPAPVAPLSAPTGLPKSAALPDPPVKPTTPRSEPVKPEVPKAAATPTERAPESAAVKPASGDSYVVAIGAFNNKERAQDIQAKVSKAGVRAYAETVRVDGSDQVRLRAGPFASRDAAEKARGRLEELGRDLGFKPGPVRQLEKRA
jgi:DedD protein